MDSLKNVRIAFNPVSDGTYEFGFDYSKNPIFDHKEEMPNRNVKTHSLTMSDLFNCKRMDEMSFY